MFGKCQKEEGIFELRVLMISFDYRHIKNLEVSIMTAEGYIDRIIYGRENNELLMQAENYRREIDILESRILGEDSRLDELKKLMGFTENSHMLREFDDELFSKYVSRIIVFSRNEVGFELKCGLTLKERI